MEYPGTRGADAPRAVESILDTGDSHSRHVLKTYSRLTKPLTLAGGAIDADTLAARMYAEFPWMGDVVEVIADDVRLAGLGKPRWFRFRPLLLLGPPGSGKTRFARKLAEYVGVGFRVVAAGGLSHALDLLGISRVYESTQPSAPVIAMLNSGTANPIVLVDEVDKAGGSERHGRVHDALLGLTELETARSFPDECLMTPVDLSGVSWIMTANSIDALPRPLLDRVRVLRVSAPPAEAFDGILQSIIRDIAEEYGLAVEALPQLDMLAHDRLRRTFKRGTSLRRIRAAVVRALGASADGGHFIH